MFFFIGCRPLEGNIFHTELYNSLAPECNRFGACRGRLDNFLWRWYILEGVRRGAGNENGDGSYRLT